MESRVRVADEVWIALALLTRKAGSAASFTARAILDRVRKEGAHPELRAGLQAHIHQHAVANAAPGTARYRMLFRLDDGTFRLFRLGDRCHPERTGKTHPDRSEVPAKYHPLIDWYERVHCAGVSHNKSDADPILSLRGLGKTLWTNVDVDSWVNELRAGWRETDLPSSLPKPGRMPESEQVWRRIVRHQNAEFRTATDLPYTYSVEGDSGIWFFRDGKRVEQRLWRGEVEQALSISPVTRPSDLSRFKCPSYLFGLLNDPRIVGGDRT